MHARYIIIPRRYNKERGDEEKGYEGGGCSKYRYRRLRRRMLR
jgi:hypothetical protein